MESRPPGSGPRSDRPRTNSDPAEIERKRALLSAPHVAPLAAFVGRMRESKGAEAIPDFDPTDGGTDASILILLEAPGRRATAERGSGFISADNNDASAENMWRLFKDAGIDRREVVSWNIVPWYVGDMTRIRAATSADLEEARAALGELLKLLPQLRVVVLLGRAAARGWGELGYSLPAIEAPHPSPKNLNTRPDARGKILASLKQARIMADAR